MYQKHSKCYVFLFLVSTLSPLVFFLFQFSAFTLYLQISYICIYIFTLFAPIYSNIPTTRLPYTTTKLYLLLLITIPFSSTHPLACGCVWVCFYVKHFFAIFLIFFFVKIINLYQLKYILLLLLAFEIGLIFFTFSHFFTHLSLFSVLPKLFRCL